MIKVRFLYNFLFINDCEEILFPLGIRGLIQLDDLVIVFIYAATEGEMDLLPTANIFAYDSRGDKVWQIEEPPQQDGRVVSYADVSLRGSDKIVAGTTTGTEYLVDLKNGSISPYGSGRPW